ncbi:MAG: PLDc N-terminal domain-containing protein, partial [Oscillospiraceae bacterium]|nr:PLDc N-terminal domain-containing protein [Oscillospiraceae bacterium]
MNEWKRKLKSLVRIVFGRTMVVVLGLALQVFFLVSALSFFYDNYVYFSIASAVLSIIVIIWIINDSTNPYYKLAWIIPVTLIPVFGTILYVFVKMEWGTHVMNRRILSLIDDTAPFIEQNEETLAELSENSVREKNLAEYMRKYAGYPIWKNTYAEYYPLGEDAFEAMVRELEDAKEFIFMEYF